MPGRTLRQPTAEDHIFHLCRLHPGPLDRVFNDMRAQGRAAGFIQAAPKGFANAGPGG